MHKKTLQVEVQDPDGNVVSNRKVQNTPPAIRREFAAIPQDTLCVMESSSVWYERFRFIRDDLGYDVVLSNPAQTKAIAASKKKTDKVDAHILADLLRGGYIAESHVPGKEVIAARQLVRYRHDKVQQRTQCTNTIHGILLQGAVTIPGATFSNAYTQTLRKMDDYRITENLRIIDCINDIVHHGRITKKGNKLVRHVLVEAAHNHARFAPHSKLTQFYRRIQAKRGTSKAAVATASKMAHIMYQMLKNGREF